MSEPQLWINLRNIKGWEKVNLSLGTEVELSANFVGKGFHAMPLSYSISNGILIGMTAYVLTNLICGKFKKLTPAMYILAALFILKYIFI